MAVVADGCCEPCNSGVETSSHLFWECNRAPDVWHNLKLFHTQTFFHFGSLMDMVWYGVVEAEWDKEQIEKMVMVAWSLWKSRNEFRTGGVKKNAVRIGSDALEYLAEYQHCVKEPVYSQVAQQAQPEVWKPPPRNKFKINIDGAVFADQKAAGVGVLIRDELGNTIGALSKKLWAPLKVVDIVAKAVEIGLQFVKELFIQDFII